MSQLYYIMSKMMKKQIFVYICLIVSVLYAMISCVPHGSLHGGYSC